jgi:hypothetical protein
MDRPSDKTLPARLRPCAAALAVVAALSLAIAAPAGAVSGGAGTIASSEAEAGADLVFSPTKSAGATWYGPGFYGHRTACGQTLRPGTVGVAHRSLPCGTAVKFSYHGHSLVARVIDRGPYAKGVSWDLTNGARERLGFKGAGRVHYAIALQYARR